jgi:hypothetical protein
LAGEWLAGGGLLEEAGARRSGGKRKKRRGGVDAGGREGHVSGYRSVADVRRPRGSVRRTSEYILKFVNLVFYQMSDASDLISVTIL